jgi:hypothetical protein
MKKQQQKLKNKKTFQQIAKIFSAISWSFEQHN